jgi:endonuclease/exonuclease/phosphatase family metal-dependent hydrolase
MGTVAPDSHPWGPVVVNRPARAERRSLKVVAFNACSGRALDKISKALRQPPLSYPDIILLSEMDWCMRRSGRREAAAELSAELGMSFAYIGEFTVSPSAGQPTAFLGSAILSGWPLADVRVLTMARSSIRPRFLRLRGAPAGLAAKITVNSRTLALGVAHLSSRWNPTGRELQMRQFLGGFPSGIPAIIGGDFNTTTVGLRSPTSFFKVLLLTLFRPARFQAPQRWEPLFERLREAGFDITGANVCRGTFTPTRLVPPFFRPKLDWLAVRGLKPARSSAAVIPARLSSFGRRFSDHDFVMCTVEC